MIEYPRLLGGILSTENGLRMMYWASRSMSSRLRDSGTLTLGGWLGHHGFMHNVEVWLVLGLGRIGVEDDKYGVAVGRGEGRENGDELGMGRIHEGEMKPLVRDGVIGSV